VPIVRTDRKGWPTEQLEPAHNLDGPFEALDFLGVLLEQLRREDVGPEVIVLAERDLQLDSVSVEGESSRAIS
jgi:hypothetical protein